MGTHRRYVWIGVSIQIHIVSGVMYDRIHIIRKFGCVVLVEEDCRVGVIPFAAVERIQAFVAVDLDEIAASEGELGYWFERAAWGQGFAAEAARAVVRFAFVEASLSALRSGHAANNIASGRVLTRLGFRLLDQVERPSRSRGEMILQCRYQLACADFPEHDRSFDKADDQTL